MNPLTFKSENAGRPNGCRRPAAATARDECLLARRILVPSRQVAWPPNAREKDYHEFG